MSITAEVLLALRDAAAPLTARQVLDACETKTTLANVWQALSAHKRAKLLEAAGKSEGGGDERSATTYRLTDAGRALVKDVEAGGKLPRGGVSRKTKGKGRRWSRRRAKGAHQRAKAAHSRGKRASAAARKAWKTRRAAARPAAAAAHAPAAGPALRWAFAQDGALMLLGTTTEIPRAAVRSLLAFLRKLDESLVLDAEA